MSKYIGTPVVNVSVDTVDVTGDITTTDTTPEVIIVNNTHEDTDGGREGKVTFKGQQSGGEETTLAQIQASHDGTSDDEKGDLIFKTNDGSDGASPTERMRIDSLGNVGIGVTPKTGGSTWQHVQFGGTGNIIARHSDSTVDTIFANNYYINSSGTDSYIATGDAARMFFNDDVITFSNAGSGSADAAISWNERMRIDSDGNLLVGATTTIASNVIATFATSNSSTATSAGNGAAIAIKNTDTTDNNYSTIYFVNSADGIDSAIYGVHEDADGTGTSRSGELAFATANTGGGVSERMRIDSSGNLQIGKTNGSSDYFLHVMGTSSKGSIRFDNAYSSQTVCLVNNTSNANYNFAVFENGGSSKGNILVSTTGTSYITSSDHRMKENITDITDGITRVKQLSPKRFNFIADADTTVDGFLAHEAQTVVPEAVTGTHNEVDDDNNPVYQGIDQSKLVPLLTAALQEAIAKIETLETKVTALEGE